MEDVCKNEWCDFATYWMQDAHGRGSTEVNFTQKNPRSLTNREMTIHLSGRFIAKWNHAIRVPSLGTLTIAATGLVRAGL